MTPTTEVVKNFLPHVSDFEVENLGSGLIHKTLLVSCGDEHHVFQRLNHHVFPNLTAVMNNIAQVTTHLQREGIPTLDYLATDDGKHLVVDSEGFSWRCSRHIPDAITYDIPPTPVHLKNAAMAFAQFAKSLSKADCLELSDTIPDFHNTPKRYQAMEKAWEEAPQDRQSVADFYALRHAASGYEEWGLGGLLPPQVPCTVSHNDTKLNNCLFEGESERVLCVIDLDTVMPGSWLMDFGDLCRTSICPLPEDTDELDAIDVDIDRFRALVEGYAQVFGSEILPEERERMVYAAFILTYELALRFFTDHLQEDRYFGAKYPGHNLVRTRSQLTLALRILARREAMDRVVKEAFSGATV